VKRLREQWPWNPGFLRLMPVVPSTIGIVAAAASYPAAGAQALWFLSAIPVGMLLRGIYGAVGRRVERLGAAYENEPGDVAEGLLVTGKVQSPGLAVLRSGELVLVPLVGEGCTIPLDELQLLKEGRTLQGKYVWGKRAFILRPHAGKRVAFAIAETIGERWSRALRAGPSENG